jgi:aerobic-type carbon monoxide dehydrogenase small subunit (CoxS/CutS family)
MAKLSINGQTVDIDVEPDTPLLWAVADSGVASANRQLPSRHQRC